MVHCHLLWLQGQVFAGCKEFFLALRSRIGPQKAPICQTKEVDSAAFLPQPARKGSRQWPRPAVK